jgi:hypothetical protein
LKEVVLTVNCVQCATYRTGPGWVGVRIVTHGWTMCLQVTGIVESQVTALFNGGSIVRGPG